MFVLRVNAESQGAVLQEYTMGSASSIPKDSALEGRPYREKTVSHRKLRVASQP